MGIDVSLRFKIAGCAKVIETANNFGAKDNRPHPVFYQYKCAFSGQVYIRVGAKRS